MAILLQHYFVEAEHREGSDGITERRGLDGYVRSTIQMARELGFHVVAEGVENHATRQQLFRFGCDTAQGNYLSPPLPAAELEEWIDIRSNPPATARSLRR